MGLANISSYLPDFHLLIAECGNVDDPMTRYGFLCRTSVLGLWKRLPVTWFTQSNIWQLLEQEFELRLAFSAVYGILVTFDLRIGDKGLDTFVSLLLYELDSLNATSMSVTSQTYDQTV